MVSLVDSSPHSGRPPVPNPRPPNRLRPSRNPPSPDEPPRSGSLGSKPRSASTKCAKTERELKTKSLELERDPKTGNLKSASPPKLDREHRSTSLKSSHDQRKKHKIKKPLISRPLYIEPIIGTEFKNSAPAHKRTNSDSVRRDVESFAAFLEKDVYLHSVMMAKQRHAGLFGGNGVCGAVVSSLTSLSICPSVCLSATFPLPHSIFIFNPLRDPSSSLCSLL